MTAQATGRRLRAYISVLAVVAVAITVGAWAAGVGSSIKPGWATLPFLGIGLAVAAHLRVRFRRGNDVDSITLFEAVLTPLMFGFPPQIVVATVVAAQIGTSLIRRPTFIKGVFNVAQWALIAAVGSIIFSLHADHAGRQKVDIPAAIWLTVALVVMGVLNNVAFTVVIAISGEKSVRTVLYDLRAVILPGWVGGWAINVLIGLLFLTAIDSTPAAVVLIPVPLFMVHLAYRGYASARAERVRMNGLRRATATLSEPIQPQDAFDGFLRDVTRCFEARGAALILFDEAGDFDVFQVNVDGSAAHHVEPMHTVSLASVLVGQPDARRVAAADSDAIAALFGEHGWRDCICAPLVDEQVRMGALAVFDRGGMEVDVKADLGVLETLGRETAHTIARGRLFESVAEERRKLDRIVGTTSDGIFTLADDGTVLSWNAGCEEITGLAATDVVGRRDALNRLHARAADGTPIDITGWLETGLPAEVIITRDDHGHRRLSCSASTATDVDSSTTTLVVVARDITPAEEYEELQQQFARLMEAQAAQRLVVDHLQQAVAPKAPDIRDTALAVAYVASDESSPTGGDLYDWHLLATGELHVAVVDVLGHGVEATKDALLVIHALRFAAADGTPLGDMVRRADDLLSAQASDVVATCVVGRYQPDTGVVEVVSGGHPPALLVGADGVVNQLAATGGAIGWPGVGSDNVVTTRLNADESLVFYTDGLIEARKNVIDGMDLLVGHAADIAQLSADDFASELVTRSLRGAKRRDDSLALVLRRTRARVAATRMSWDASPDSESEVREARQSLESWLGEHDAAADDAVLIAGELIANAVVAARSSVVVSAELEGDNLVLEVSDDGEGDDRLVYRGLQRPGLDKEDGRGLFLVRELSNDVSIMSTSEGTVVRCVLPHQSEPGGARVRTGGVGTLRIGDGEFEPL